MGTAVRATQPPASQPASRSGPSTCLQTLTDLTLLPLRSLFSFGPSQTLCTYRPPLASNSYDHTDHATQTLTDRTQWLPQTVTSFQIPTKLTFLYLQTTYQTTMHLLGSRNSNALSPLHVPTCLHRPWTTCPHPLVKITRLYIQTAAQTEYLCAPRTLVARRLMCS